MTAQPPRRRSASVSRRTTFLLALALAHVLGAATIVHRPYLQNLGPDHVTVMFSARENQPATVQYSTDASFSRSVTASVRSLSSSVTNMGFTLYQYRAEIAGLSAGAKYNYRVIVGGQTVTPENDQHFATPGDGPFSFLVFGDSGDGSSHQTAVTLQMANEQPNFVIHVGDIAYQSGTYNEFNANYFDYYATLMARACFFTIAGNHEYYTDNSSPYLNLHAPPADGVPQQDAGRYYSFDWGPIHFVGLDANLLDPQFAAASVRMLNWLDSDLTNSQALWKIAFFHQTPYPTSHHTDDPIDLAAHDQFVPILERHGVQLVLTGHEHNYQRTKPIRGDRPVTAGPSTVYMVSGGGGGVLHDFVNGQASFVQFEALAWHYLRINVDAGSLTLHAIGTDGKEFDRVTLNQPPRLNSSDAVVNGASFTTELAPGGFVSIFGQALAGQAAQAARFPLPTALGGTTVTWNGTPLALTFVSPGQVNAQLPFDALGSGTLRVSTATGFAETSATITDVAPAIFPNAITHANGALVTPASEAVPGETLIVYMTGLGQVDGKIAAGQASPSSPLLHVVTPIQVQIGDVSVLPDFAGLTPGFAGVYQLNVTVPQSLPAKVYPLRVTEKGSTSNTMNLQLQSRNP